MSDDNVIEIEVEAGDEDEVVDLLPPTASNICLCLRFASCRCVALLRFLLYVGVVTLLGLLAWVMLSLCNTFLLMQPLARRLNGAHYNMSTGCPYVGNCTMPLMCADESRSLGACFAVSLAVSIGEVVALAIVVGAVRSLWLAYSRERAREIRRAVKNE